MRWLRAFLWCWVLMLFLFPRHLLSGEVVYIFTLKRLPHFPSSFYVIEDIQELCRYKKIVIYGAESFRRVQNIACPNQQRLVAGILYITHFYNPSFTYLYPLPAPEILSKFARSYVVIDSGIFDFYLSALEREVKLRRIKIKNWYELEKALSEAKRTNEPLLLLPDPLLIDQRAQIILKKVLEDSQMRVINLLGQSLGLPKEISLNFFPERYFQFIQKMYDQSSLEQGAIYYVNSP